ncbi:unnamed protein product [Lactuca saligna]|uniref:Uncharacterized protein n=1 Tax=Lactuca saligna TaxID=75948 RepID=A0AA36EF13_LACSI|nr:unnamed protein product [Lactuca saligna]
MNLATEFPTLTAARVFVDDVAVFPNVARISDSMLKVVDPQNWLLAPKKKKQVEKQHVVEEENLKETIPTKTRVLKCTKKPTKKPSESPINTTIQEPIVEIVEPTVVKTSNSFSSKGGPKKAQKLQFTRKGVFVCEVPCLGSPTSKKCQALDVAQQLKRRKHDQFRVPLENVHVETEQGSESDKTDIRIEYSFIGSL